MKTRGWVGVAAIVILLAFAGGFWVGGERATHLPVLIGDGVVGEDVATFQVGDVSYGFRADIAWRDRGGVEHAGGWPDCLPKLTEVKALRFSATTLWYGNVGSARMVWVDCQGR